MKRKSNSIIKCIMTFVLTVAMVLGEVPIDGLVMVAKAETTTSITVNVTGSGSVSIGNQTATAGNPFTASVDDGASVTLTFAPDAGNIVTSAKLSYKTSEYGNAEEDIAISGSTATFQIPNNIRNGTGVTINVTFGDGLAGGADKASAVALTDATVSNLAGGYYKVESDISFDHTLNLIGDTYLVIASGAKMTVSSSEYGINGGSYALNVLGEGTLSVTTTGSYEIAVCVSGYTQLGCSVNLTTTYIGMRCSDSFNISGGSFKTNGSEGIWPNNAVNISGGKLEASNIDANINLSYSNTDDYIKVDNYTSGNTMTIASGQTFTDGTTNYSGTITNLSPLNGKKLFPFVYTHLTVRDATCTEVGIKQECWQRSSDGKYFSDANGTSELSVSDVETSMIPHTGVRNDATDTHIEYWQCSVCSKYFSNSDCTTEITEEDTKIYRTITIDDGVRDYVTSNVDKAVAGTTVTLTVSHLIDASTLRVNDDSVALTDAGNGTYTFTMPADDVTVTASTATTYSVNLPANMEIVSATNTADGSGKYISGTVVTFKASFSYTASNVYDGANTLTADDSGNYSVTVGTADITVTATIEHSSNIDLSQAPSDFTVVDGDVLTGSTSHTVTIANNAKITLNNATITGGIVCDGTAEITLVGENAVGVTSLDGTLIYQTAGIQIGGSGKTLTIKGDGSLSATGGSAAAGIGLGRTWDDNATGGSIVIEGGTVTASGGNGIGTGTVGNSMTATIGDIVIKGGTVNARLGKGTINNGSTATIGAIKIYDTIDKVDASAITESVTYMHDDTDVTASASTYFIIIEDGDRRIIEKKDDTDYTITIADGIEHGSIAYAAETAKYGDKVTITATPDFGYRLSRLVVKDAQNNDVATTGNTFLMPKGNVTVSAVFEQGTHGTTEFAWGYFGLNGIVTKATIYDGLTTVNLQQGQSYQIFKYDNGYNYRKFLLDNSTYEATIPYSGGTGTFPEYGNGTTFRVDYNSESGFYDITMTDVGNGKWSVSILKTVGKMDDIPDQTYTGSAITPEPLVLAGSLSLTKGTDYEYSYSDNINVGTAKVTVAFKGDYASLGSVEKEFHICKTVNNPTIQVAAATYTGEALEPAVTVKDGDTEISSDEYTVSYTNNINAGMATVIITDKEGRDYIVSGSKTFTIAPKPVTITGLSASDKVYDGTTVATVTGTASINGKIGEDDVSVDASAGTGTFDNANVGTGKTVTFNGYSLDGTAASNYTLSDQPASVTASITARPITITAADQSVELNSEIATGTDKWSVSGELADGQSISAVTLTASSTASVGSGTVTPSAAVIKDASGNDVTSNYNITYMAGTLTVTKIKAKITTAPMAKTGLTYSGADQALITAGAADTSMEYVLGTSATTTPGSGYSADVPGGTDAKTYYIWYRAKADDDHEASDSAVLTVEIARATQSIEASNVTATYGDTGKSVSASVTAPATGGGEISYAVKSGSEDYIDVNATNGALTIKKAGTATVIVTAAETVNYAQAIKEVTVTVAKADIGTPTLSIQNKTYDGHEITYTIENHPGGGQVTAISWEKKNSDENWSSFGDTPKDAGKYRGTAVIAETDNYKGATTNTAEFTISKADSAAASVTAKNRTYDGTDKPLVTVTGETKGGEMKYYSARVEDTDNPPTAPTDESLYTTSIPTAVGAGTYYVWYKVIGDANHNDTEPQSVQVSVAKAAHENQTANGSAKFGASGTVDLSALIVKGGTVGAITETDSSNVLNGDTSVSDGRLNYAFKDAADNAGKTAAVTVPVTSENYADYRIIVTLTVNAKDVPTLTVAPITKTYDGAAVTYARISGTATVNGTAVAGTWTFEGGASFINAADSGAKKVLFTPDNREIYDTAEAMLALTIN